MVKYDNIPGFPGYYISKRGGLWSNRKNGQWKKLKPHLNKMWNRYQCTLRDSRGIRIFSSKCFEDCLDWNSEIETIGNYKKIMNNLALYSERADYDDVMYLLNKLIADEEHHIKLIKEAMGVDDTKKGVTVIIK
jgi:hypothetical protein